MRILLDGRTIKKNPSGLGVWNINLICELLKQAEIEKIFVLTARTCDFEFEKHPRLEIVKTDDSYQLTGFRRFVFEQFVLARIIKKLKVDVYHATDSFGIPWNLPKNVKTVLTIHDLIPLTKYREPMSLWDLFLYRHSLRISFLKATQIVAISEKTKRDLFKYFRVKPEVVQVIHDGVELSQKIDDFLVKEAWRRLSDKYQLEAQKFILYFGGFGRRRNVPMLIEVFHKIKKSNPRFANFKLFISGRIKGAKKSYLESYTCIKKLIADLHLANEVIVADFLAGDEKEALIKNAAVSAFLTLYEGFGFAPAEVIASKKTLVLTRVGIWHEFKPENKFVIDDPLSLKETQRKIEDALSVPSQLDDADYFELINFIAKFSFAKMGREYLDLYKKICQK